jgi:hypothetical protein
MAALSPVTAKHALRQRGQCGEAKVIHSPQQLGRGIRTVGNGGCKA